MKEIRVITIKGEPVYSCTNKKDAEDWVALYRKVNGNDSTKKNVKITQVPLREHSKPPNQ